MDNCSAQNKNWCLVSAIVSLVNSDEISADKITFKFLEAGHTFMSADSVHAVVEKQIKTLKNICDFDDFVKCVISSKTEVFKMVCTDFFALGFEQSQAKLGKTDFLLPQVRVLQFRRGSKSLFYKKRHSDVQYAELDFMKKKSASAVPIPLQPFRKKDRGISKAKKEDIIKKLVPLMPANRKKFWNEIAVTDQSPDLIDQDDP